MTFDDFGEAVQERASSRIDKAVLFASYFVYERGANTASLKQIETAFTSANLPAPNVTKLRDMLRRDSRVSTVKDAVKPRKGAKDFLYSTFPEFVNHGQEASTVPDAIRVRIEGTPLIDANYIEELSVMASYYVMLHALENSMRRVIEVVLFNRFGIDWWSNAANAALKRKHDDRLVKEVRRQWLPARSSLGPLYSLDWGDLIGIMRRFESEFLPIIGEVEFLHRFNDLGLLRHVIAHNGFVEGDSELERIKLALQDWQKQVSSRLPH